MSAIVAKNQDRSRRVPQPPLPLQKRRAHRQLEVCRALGISKATFWRWRKAGLIRVVYIGSMAFVTDQHLDELLAERPVA
jgi:predicted DNA-binding transcriptional regulator AlpA